MYCVIEDNGIGRLKAAQLMQMKTHHESKGLKIVGSRLQILQNRSSVEETGFKIIDLSTMQMKKRHKGLHNTRWPVKFFAFGSLLCFSWHLRCVTTCTCIANVSTFQARQLNRQAIHGWPV